MRTLRGKLKQDASRYQRTASLELLAQGSGGVSLIRREDLQAVAGLPRSPVLRVAASSSGMPCARTFP
jgi:hypothetical protein